MQRAGEGAEAGARCVVHLSTVSTSEQPEEDLREAVEAVLSVPPGWLRTAAPQSLSQDASKGTGTSPPPDPDPSPLTSSGIASAAAPSKPVRLFFPCSSAMLCARAHDATCVCERLCTDSGEKKKEEAIFST